MRAFKKFIYGVFYLAIFGGIIFWVYSGWLKPAPGCFNGVQDKGEQGIDCGGVCSRACGLSDLVGIQAEGQPMVFHPTPSTVSVMVEVKNPNPGFSARKFYYKFSLLDAAGNQVPGGDIHGESFIYASEIKYIAEFNKSIASSSEVVSADFAVAGEPQWVSESFFAKPKIAVQNSSTSVSIKDIEVNGNIINNDTISFSTVDVLAVIYSKLGQPLGISKTEITGINPGQQQTFSISHPLVPGSGIIDTAATKIYLYGY